MRNFLTTLIFLLACKSIVAQQLDPTHYPPESEWEYLKIKRTDSVIVCMRYYFMSDDTLYFREHPSQKVVKLASSKIYLPGFDLGKDYQFASKGAAISTRLFYSKKLDRYYDYYLHAPAYKLNEAVPYDSEEQEMAANMFSWNLPQGYNPNATFGQLPLKVLYHKSGCKFVLQHYYFLSNGELFFKLADREGVFTLPLSEIVRAEGIYKLGKDFDLGHRYKYRKRTKNIVLTGIIIYPTFPVMLPIGIFRTVRHYRYRNAKSLNCASSMNEGA